jgi:general secretion pathway protein B
MSYILEALQRSQQERELGQVPNLEQAAPAPARPRPAPGIWLAAALGLAALAVAIALYALLDQHPGSPDPAASGPAPGVSPRQTTPPPAPLPAARQTTPPPAPATPARQAGVAPALPPAPPRSRPEPGDIPADLRAEVERFRQALTTPPAATAEPSPVPVTPPAPRPSPAAAAPPEPTLSRLDPGLRSRLPPLNLSVHVYSARPAGRFVVLDSRKLREGDTTDGGVQLVEIRPGGVVLQFRDQRFLLER